jgi:hypothetical protein
VADVDAVSVAVASDVSPVCAHAVSAIVIRTPRRIFLNRVPPWWFFARESYTNSRRSAVGRRNDADGRNCLGASAAADRRLVVSGV